MKQSITPSPSLDLLLKNAATLALRVSCAACHDKQQSIQHTQNYETIQEKVNSQLCQCCRTWSKSNSDCAWTVNLLGEKMGFFEYNIHILSRRMFFRSSSLDVDEFTSVHIAVCGNILQTNTRSRLFQKPLLLKDVFLISASLIYSLQVRSVTVLSVRVWLDSSVLGTIPSASDISYVSGKSLLLQFQAESLSTILQCSLSGFLSLFLLFPSLTGLKSRCILKQRMLNSSNFGCL